MPTPLPTIFLSYARSDDEPFVRRLYDDLTARGFDVWFDRVSMPNRGLTFTDEIRRAITARDRLLLVVGPRAVASEYVQQEWSCALDLDKPVHPVVRLGEVTQLPERLALYDARFMQLDENYQPEFSRLVDQLLTDPPRLGALHAVPTLPHHFLERPESLRRLRDALTADLERKIAMTGAASRVGAQGMGGIGKSVLATCVARDPKVRRLFPDGIFWVPLGEAPTLVELQRDLARELGDIADFAGEAAGRQRLRELLQERQALVILDDLWQAAHAEAFDVLGPICRMLVTTRDASLVTTLGGQHYEVQLLSDDEALRLLAWWAGVDVEQVPALGKQIVAECGRLPLALSICGAMIRDHRPWNDVLADLQEAELEFLQHDLPNYPHKDVWKAIKIGVDGLAREQPEFRDRFAELAVFPSDESVPEATVEVLWAHTGGMKERRTRDLLRLMAAKSLIRLDSDSQVGRDTPPRVSLHDLIHDFATPLAGNPQRLHEQWLAAYRSRSPADWWETPDDGYFFQHLRHHLIAAGRADELADLVMDLSWVERKVQLGLTFDLPADYKSAVDAVQGSDDVSQARATSGTGLLQRLSSADQPPTQAGSDRRLQRGVTVELFANFLSANASAFAVQPDSVLYRALNYADRGPVVEAAWERLRPGAAVADPSQFRSVRPPLVYRESLLRSLPSHRAHVNAVHVLPDGRTAASIDSASMIRLWDVGTGKCVLTHRLDAAIMATCLLDRGATLAALTDESRIELWTLPAMQRVASLSTGDDQPRLLASHAIGATFITGNAAGEIDLWDGTCRARIRRLGSHPGRLRAIAVSGDGKTVASGGDEGVLRLWDVQRGLLREAAIDRQPIRCVWLSADGHIAASAADDWRVSVRDTQFTSPPRTFEGHSSAVAAICGTPDASVLLTCGRWDRHVLAWNVDSGSVLRSIRCDDVITCCDWSSAEPDLVVTGHRSGVVNVWNLLPQHERSEEAIWQGGPE